MSKPLRPLLSLLLVIPLFLAACAPLVADHSGQDRERIALLQKKLQHLQEQLAAMEAAPPQGARNWRPLLAGTSPPGGHPGYSYLLYAGDESPAGLKRLAALLDLASSAPPPGSESAPGLLMLVPLTADAPRPTIENYDFTAARTLLESIGLTPSPAPGPLLLTTRHPLEGPEQPAILLIPGDATGKELEALLANYRTPISDSDEPLAKLCWNLLQASTPGSLAAVRRGHVVLLQRP